MLTRGSCLRSIFCVDIGSNQATTRALTNGGERVHWGLRVPSAAYVKSCVDTCQQSVANLSICQTRGIKKWSIAYRLFRPSPGICAPTQPSASRSSLHGTDRPTDTVICCHKVSMLPSLSSFSEPLTNLCSAGGTGISDYRCSCRGNRNLNSRTQRQRLAS